MDGGSERYGDSVNHKRKRPKHLRSGCLHCKAWKDERAAKGDRLKPNLRRKLQSEDEG